MGTCGSADVFGLAGRVCVVTGGGGGIGRAIAQLLAAEGGKIAVLDRNGAAAEETRGLIEAASPPEIDACAVECDASDQPSIEDAAEQVRRKLGRAQVLVNCIGISRPGPLENLSLADWNAMLAANLSSYFLCSQAFGRQMRETGGGAIVHVSSIQATFVRPLGGAYSTSKAGVSMLSRQLAVEWGPAGIRSNAVHPGWVYTPMSAHLYDRPGFTERRAAMVPCGRIGLPEDTAQAVLFLASARASYVNGAELLVDGGLASNLMGLVPRAD